MLSYDEKKKIKDILDDGLNINKDIRFSYFLDAIDSTNKITKDLETKINSVLRNQKLIDEKLNIILQSIR
ncbi:MAG: hypothetical protein K9L02_07530 [Acholeplasmataceae bacterium]|nr:hypothetical protein [Acholeplasmataceae bacterium]